MSVESYLSMPKSLDVKVDAQYQTQNEQPPAVMAASVDALQAHLALDAPVVALVRRLHAGTTLADRVRKMRGRREGMRLRRLAKQQTTTTQPTKETTHETTGPDRQITFA